MTFLLLLLSEWAGDGGGGGQDSVPSFSFEIFGSSRADPEPVVGADGTIIFHRFIYFVLTNGFISSPASLLCVQGQLNPSAGVQRCSKAGAMCNELSPHVPAAFVSRSEVFR